MSQAARGAFLTMLALAVSCTVTTGNRGVLGFGFDSSDTIMPAHLDKALATGDEIELVVYAPKQPGKKGNYTVAHPAGGKPELGRDRVKKVPATGASSRSPETVRVVGIVDGRIRLRGIAVGTAQIDVTTTAGVDTIGIRVDDVARVALDHWTAKSHLEFSPSTIVLLKDGVAHFTITRTSASGKALTGYGAARAAAVLPRGAAVITGEPRDSSHLRVRPTKVGPLTIELRPARVGAQRTTHVVNATEVTRLTVEPIISDESKPLAEQEPLRIDASLLLSVVAHVRDDRRALGLDGLVSVRTTTPLVCEAVGLKKLLGDGALFVTGLAPGTCTIEATLGHIRGRFSVTFAGR